MLYQADRALSVATESGYGSAIQKSALVNMGRLINACVILLEQINRVQFSAFRSKKQSYCIC